MIKYYQWTETANGNEVMGAKRVGGEIFTSDDFTPSQIQHLVGMSFATPTECPSGTCPKPEPKPKTLAPYTPHQVGTYDEIVERLENIYIESGWTAIKALASNYGITEKPDGGWDEAIPLIAQAEYAQLGGE